jgi:hypothetical protein
LLAFFSEILSDRCAGYVGVPSIGENAHGGQTETENKKEPTRETAKEQKYPAASDQ